MKLWILTNNTVTGYDTFDSCIVAAKTEEAARLITPGSVGRYVSCVRDQKTFKWNTLVQLHVKYMVLF